jgi:uncharacterized protein involved in type VI secretion and phage assembly
MEAFLTPSRPVNQYFGVYPAIVVDNVDPEGRYRVKVKFPWMMESDSKYVDTPDKENMNSTWARIASPMAGTNKHNAGKTDELRGFFFLPEKEDEVLVCFGHGDFRDPYIVGQLYNGEDLPFYNNKDGGGDFKAKGNDFRAIRSRSGHMLIFVDTSGKERVVIQAKVKDDNVYDAPAVGGSNTKPKEAKGGGGPSSSYDTPDGSAGGHMIVLDMTSGKEKIVIADKDGKNALQLDSAKGEMTITTQGKMYFHSKGDMCLMTEGNLYIESKSACEMNFGSTLKAKSGGTWDQEAGGTMTEKAPKIDLNP